MKKIKKLECVCHTGDLVMSLPRHALSVSYFVLLTFLYCNSFVFCHVFMVLEARFKLF